MNAMLNRDKTTHRPIDPADLSTGQIHEYLLSAIAPRPIALVSTKDQEGRVNLSPFSYFNVFGANPPVLIFSPARRVRDNTTKHTLDNVLENPEAIVNIVDFDMVEQMSLSSTEYPRGVNEFEKSGLTQIPGHKMNIPRVGESPVSFECRVQQVIHTGKDGGAGNLVICHILMIHVREDILTDDGRIDPLKLDLVGRMGANWYCRASGDSLFEIPKPVINKGIGVDALPESARWSKVLTGNELGRLGNSPRKPTEEEITTCRVSLEKNDFFRKVSGSVPDELHRLVSRSLMSGEAEKALALVWLADTMK